MRSLKSLLLLFCAESFLSVIWTLLTPSESGKAVLLWLSRERLLLLALAIGIWLVITIFTLFSWRSSTLLDTIQSTLDRTCLEGQRLGALLLFLFVPPPLLLAATLAVLLAPSDYASYRLWAPDTFPLLRSLVLAALPLLLLAIALMLELGVFAALRYRAAVTDPVTWSWSRIAPSLLLLVVSILTLFYWLVLIFQLRFFVNNPAWYWKFAVVPFNRGDLFFLVIALLLLAIIWWVLIIRRRVLPGLLLIFVLGLFLQLGVGLMSGGGFSYFLDRYFSTYHKTYISKAAQGSVSIVEDIRNYEQLYGGRQFTNTKPPGLMAFYIALDHLVNGHPSAYTDAQRYDRLSAVVAFAYPVLGLLLVFALYAFARRYIPGRFELVPAIAAFLIALCPDFILFSLFPDQAIYPLLFLFGVFLIALTVHRQSFILAFILGLFLYLAVFFAFTMLPLLPFAGIFLFLDYWMHRHEQPLLRPVLLGLSMAAGLVLLYVLFRLLLNYDFLPRFARAVAINHNFDFYLRVHRPPPSAPESLPVRLGQILGAVWLNHWDFAAAIGFPIYILFVVQGLQLLRRIWKDCASSGDSILGALLLSFIVLNLAGTAQGEVPRLWLFWLPTVVLLAALQLESWVKHQPRWLLVLAAAQLVTLFLTFHFQDLRM